MRLDIGDTISVWFSFNPYTNEKNIVYSGAVSTVIPSTLNHTIFVWINHEKILLSMPTLGVKHKAKTKVKSFKEYLNCDIGIEMSITRKRQLLTEYKEKHKYIKENVHELLCMFEF